MLHGDASATLRHIGAICSARVRGCATAFPPPRPRRPPMSERRLAKNTVYQRNIHNITVGERKICCIS